jgi:hypothetical protein
VKLDAVATDWRERAARIIEERGWCQGTLADEFGQVCLAGAIAAAFEVDPQTDPLRDALPPAAAGAIDALGLEVLPSDLNEDGWRDISFRDTGFWLDVLALWNDADGRSKDDVIALLRRAS